MIFNYRTVVNGCGYRFTLPSLGLPDPMGELVAVQVATSRKDPELLSAPSRPLKSSQPIIPLALGNHATRNIKHDGAVWLLPILDIASDEDPHVFSVLVRRIPSATSATKGRSAPSAPLDDPDAIVAAYWHHFWASLLDHSSSASSSEPSSSYPSRPSTSSSSGSAIPDPSGINTSTQTHVCASQGPCIPLSLPGVGLGLCVDCLELKGASRGNYLLEPDLHFQINEAFEHRLCWTKYVDRLPQGDPIPRCLTDYELAYPWRVTPWAVDVAERTFFHLAQTSSSARWVHWRDLTDAKIGHPCTIVNNEVFVSFAQPRAYHFELEGAAAAAGFISGPARLKVVPKPHDYSCQPCAASSEASYFLNHYQLLIEQNGHTRLALEPLARYITNGEDSVLSILGQYASMQPDADKLLYSPSGPLPGLDDLYNVGLRLRDGGARFPLISTGIELYRQFQVPGDLLCLATFGDSEIRRELVHLNEAEAKSKKVANVCGLLPEGPLDFLLRVIDHPKGLFDELQYAFRMRGSTKPVGEEEWKLLDPPVVDEWMVRYFLNLARLSYGHLARLL